jgi:hypothetical protein
MTLCNVGNNVSEEHNVSFYKMRNRDGMLRQIVGTHQQINIALKTKKYQPSRTQLKAEFIYSLLRGSR